MTFTQTVAEQEATGPVAEMYATDREVFGTLPNLTRALSLRPAAYAAWRQLNGAIKASMDPRRYELATLAAARRLRSSYCALAHGSVLMTGGMAPEQLRAVMSDETTAGLDAVELAVMALADRIAADATSVSEPDIDQLRSLGLTDAEIVDVVLAAAARCFFSKTLDGLGVRADAHYAQLDADLRDALVVGRPIAEA